MERLPWPLLMIHLCRVKLVGIFSFEEWVKIEDLGDHRLTLDVLY
jgi:hypothetical protein